ncbi:hypothetical protein J437_LFUL011700 [Ladona fulva]|uniref:Uncharacterized protein n=1 Tax=Ladona fulva TaxID=123851 RepID=A0A8K0PAF7_LADFU|nr:hypothetical protein J437_LFUL011700 [Ladona fulva]
MDMKGIRCCLLPLAAQSKVEVGSRTEVTSGGGGGTAEDGICCLLLRSLPSSDTPFLFASTRLANAPVSSSRKSLRKLPLNGLSVLDKVDVFLSSTDRTIGNLEIGSCLVALTMFTTTWFEGFGGGQGGVCSYWDDWSLLHMLCAMYTDVSLTRGAWPIPIRIIKFNDFTRRAIHLQVHSFCFKNTPPTINIVVNEEESLPNFKRLLFWKRLKEIGFRFEKRGNKALLKERSDIISMRHL